MLFTTSPTPMATGADAALLPPAQAETLARTLLSARWPRFSPDEQDPLSMLFTNKRWVAGWDGNDFILLIREMPSLEPKPSDRPDWFLFRNGQLIDRESERAFSRRTGTYRQLLESAELPFLSPAALLAPVHDPLQPAPHRESRAEHLLQSVMSRPELLAAMQFALSEALAEGLAAMQMSPGGADVFTETIRLQRLAALNPVARTLCAFVQNGLMRDADDLMLLHRQLQLLEDTLARMGTHPALRPLSENALRELTACTRNAPWRQRFRFRL